VSLYLSSGKRRFPEFQVWLCFLTFCLKSGGELPGLGLAFGLSEIG
jgi:hypothetical protein